MSAPGCCAADGLPRRNADDGPAPDIPPQVPISVDATLGLCVMHYNIQLAVWEPVIEPVTKDVKRIDPKTKRAVLGSKVVPWEVRHLVFTSVQSMALALVLVC